MFFLFQQSFCLQCCILAPWYSNPDTVIIFYTLFNVSSKYCKILPEYDYHVFSYGRKLLIGNFLVQIIKNKSYRALLNQGQSFIDSKKQQKTNSIQCFSFVLFRVEEQLMRKPRNSAQRHTERNTVQRRGQNPLPVCHRLCLGWAFTPHMCD